MTLKQRVTNMLETNVTSRERKHRYRAVWFILNQMYHRDTIDKSSFIEMGPDIVSIIRLINLVQSQNENLQGSDYADKKKLVQEKQIELGYTPGYYNDIKEKNQFRSDEEGCDECKRPLIVCKCDNELD